MDLYFSHGDHFFTEPEITFNKPELKGYVLSAHNLDLLDIYDEYGELIDVPVEELYIRPGGTVQPHRLENADLSFPVWVCTNMNHNTYVLIDGRHRTAKAQLLGHTSVKALSIPVERLKKVLRVRNSKHTHTKH